MQNTHSLKIRPLHVYLSLLSLISKSFLKTLNEINYSAINFPLQTDIKVIAGDGFYWFM